MTTAQTTIVCQMRARTAAHSRRLAVAVGRLEPEAAGGEEQVRCAGGALRFQTGYAGSIPVARSTT